MFKIDKKGFYGEFGGAFVDEKTKKVLDELDRMFETLKKDKAFQAAYKKLLKDYVGRPSPLYYAANMSKAYGCNIYLKREDLNHTGSHKINNTVGQILLAKKMGKKRIVAETGAGQHGVATATVCALLNMECKIFMGETDMKRQRLNVEKIQMLGAEVIPAVSGQGTLNDAVNEALGYWVGNCDDTFYLLGSAVGPNPYPKMVAYFQSVISKEIRRQLKQQTGKETPDYVIACVGGGSNATGAFYHFLESDVKLIVAEAGGLGAETLQTAASITAGKTGFIHGFKTLVLQDEQGNIREPYSISAGLDYPGVGPLYALLAQKKRITTFAVNDDEALASAMELTKKEGIIPAIESAHAVAALRKIKFKPQDTVVVNISGRGDKDMELYLTLNH